jgi:acyl-CoA synthetase (AMP-forming)/AMP-acid ligase II/3-hydroxymyristoyl/3-hydroxydecanoyl-(acyl carrier protein) dehydratase
MKHLITITDLACKAPDPHSIVCMSADNKTLTHADLLPRVDAWQAAFAASPKEQWAVYCNDPFEFSAALMGAWHANKVVILPGDDLGETVRGMVRSGCGLAGDLPGADIAHPSQPNTKPIRVPLNVAMAKLQVYTSGSQGEPVGIEKSLRQMESEVNALNMTFSHLLVDAPVVYSTVSHQHIYGLLFLILWPLSAGLAFAQKRLLYPEDMALELGPKPSVLIASPAHLKRLGDFVNWGDARQGLRAIFSSGGPLPFETCASVAQALGHIPTEVFGSSETGGIAWRQCTTATQPWIPFVEVIWKIDSGCLCVSSPRLPDEQWWTTTDLVERVGADNFRLLGRTDRVVKIEEKRVSLSAIENYLLKMPWVQEVKVIVLDTAIGQRVAGVVVPSGAGRELLSRGKRVLGETLRQALADKIEPIALPKRWRFVDALPANAQGKPTQILLAALFEEQESVGAKRPPHIPEVTWLSKTATSGNAQLAIKDDLAVFDGHFEGSPILPGVAQLDWAIALSRECFDLPAQFLRMDALKFVRPVLPGANLLLDLSLGGKASEISVAFRYYSTASDEEETVHASGKCVWASTAAGDTNA